ncbi:MAG: hypothetical protein Q7R35_06250 [Elusimicrobiota bacterium]|nr:hypothetical protein [Elusimicrobiota bacterium]
MQPINIESVIENSIPVSPDRKYSLAWSSSGKIGVLQLEDNFPVLGFRETHGAILKAGFSPDMHQIVAENEDGTISIWFTKPEIGGSRCIFPDDIVLFMSENDNVPYININPKVPTQNRLRYHVSLRDFTCATYDWFCW